MAESFKISNKSYVPKPGTFEKKWVVVDAKDQVLGRLASNVAAVLRGKNKPYFTPYVDCGDNVIIINAKDIVVSGNKEQDKEYKKYSGFPGGLKTRTFAHYRENDPTVPIRLAVKRMLPKNKLGRQLYSNLRVFADGNHNLQAQKPETITF